MSLFERVKERIVAANELLDFLQESDRFYSKQLRSFEDHQARCLGVTRQDFVSIYNKALSTVERSPARSVKTLNTHSAFPLRYDNARRPSPAPQKLRFMARTHHEAAAPVRPSTSHMDCLWFLSPRHSPPRPTTS